MVTNICFYKNSICDVCYENGRSISVLQMNQKVLMANIAYARSAGLCFCQDQSNLPEDIKCDLKDALNKECFKFEEQQNLKTGGINALLDNSPKKIYSAYAIKMQ